MLELARGLSPGHLRQLADLEKRTLDVDGGRLKLEWGLLRARSGRDVEDLLWWQGDQLLGFLGLYGFGPPDLEIAGMVDPAARRRGIASALLDAALPIARGQDYERALLVVPRGSVAGRDFALARGAGLEHSEHALVLAAAPNDGPSDPRVTLRPATRADQHDLSRLFTVGFGSPSSFSLDQLEADSERTLVVELQGSVVGTVRTTRDRDTGGVYGFVVDPAWQGRGIGRDVLRRICRQLRQEGVRTVGLEVAVENERALALYTSLGFTQVATEDYYALPLSPV
jgi:ribosomal protein S18 acetylase RimI-like enzyme